MNVRELYQLVCWIEENIKNAGIVTKFTTLGQRLQQNTQRNQQNVPFDGERQELNAALAAMSFNSLTITQIGLLEDFGVKAVLGDSGIDKLDDILFRNQLDIATASAEVSKMTGVVSSIVSWAEGIKPNLERIESASSVSKINDNEVLMRIRFAQDADISNIADLRDWSKIWFEIVHSLTKYGGQTPEDIRVVGASNGSLIYDLATYYGFAKLVLIIMKDALHVAERIQGIRIQQQTITAMKLNNAKTLRDTFSKEIEEVREGAVDKIAAQFDSTGEHDGDVVSGLRKAIEHLLSFFEKGGQVDVVDDNAAEDVDSGDGDEELGGVEEIRRLSLEVREMRAKLDSLEYDNPDIDEDS